MEEGEISDSCSDMDTSDFHERIDTKSKSKSKLDSEARVRENLLDKDSQTTDSSFRPDIYVSANSADKSMSRLGTSQTIVIDLTSCDDEPMHKPPHSQTKPTASRSDYAFPTAFFLQVTDIK